MKRPLNAQQKEFLLSILEDGFASSAIEGYTPSKKEKEYMKEMYLKDLASDEMVEQIKRDMGLNWNTNWQVNSFIREPPF